MTNVCGEGHAIKALRRQTQVSPTPLNPGPVEAGAASAVTTFCWPTDRQSRGFSGLLTPALLD